jgi:hypothetical protein
MLGSQCQKMPNFLPACIIHKKSKVKLFPQQAVETYRVVR